MLFSDAVSLIFSFAGTGRELLGAERLEDKIVSYKNEVNYNDAEIEEFLSCLAMTIMKGDDVAHGYAWAGDVIAGHLMKYYRGW